MSGGAVVGLGGGGGGGKSGATGSPTLHYRKNTGVAADACLRLLWPEGLCMDLWGQVGIHFILDL